MSPRVNRTLSVVCPGICLGLLLIGLWPLDFFPKNEVWWLKARNGLHFHGREIGSRFSGGGVAFTPSPLVSPREGLPRKGAISIEVWLRPAVEPKVRRSRIVSLCKTFTHETIFVDQWNSHLLIYWLVAEHCGQRQYRKIGVSKALIAGKIRFITITSDETEISIYLDGQLMKRVPEVRLLAESGSITGQTLLVGNTPDATRSWAGEIFGLAVYDRPLTETQVLRHFQGWTQRGRLSPPIQDSAIALYTFNERSGIWARNSVEASNPLLIPARLRFEKRVLVPPEIPHPIRASFVKDVIINVLGFIPFGFFLALWVIKARKWKLLYAYLCASVLGGGVSLTIELLQIYLPARDSSQTDLICNTLGAFLGVVVFHYAKQPVCRYLENHHCRNSLEEWGNCG